MSMLELARAARAASLTLATSSSEQRNRALLSLAGQIEGSTEALAIANAKDIEAARAAGLSAPMVDRLTLSPSRIAAMAEGVRQVAALPDPLGAVLDEVRRPNGLLIRKVRVPIGVIAVIYESRPNVTIDCAALCLKSGNSVILRGGKEAFHSNTALASLISEALASAGLPAAAAQLVPTTDRAAMQELLKLDELIHCVIPRGGEGLIRFVAENSRIPVIKHYKGVCHVYVDTAADLDRADAIVFNAKVHRPSACNAAEKLLVHRRHLGPGLVRLARSLRAAGVELRTDAPCGIVLRAAGVECVDAVDADWTEEYLGLTLTVRAVDSLQEAVDWINAHGSGHSDAIVTEDEAAARAFLAGVDSATVYWNASTRFTDGFEFGMGAEIGISTDRLHARGPMGLAELCSYKYLIEGNGQVRS
jgi:glutamate-5-semialdehyde dehydrogenase